MGASLMLGLAMWELALSDICLSPLSMLNPLLEAVVYWFCCSIMEPAPAILWPGDNSWVARTEFLLRAMAPDAFLGNCFC
jgi:hypothetical protein